MTYLLVIAAIGFLIWRGRIARGMKTAPWRASSAVLSTGLFAAAAFEGLRGGAESAGLLLVGAVALLAAARWPRAGRASASKSSGRVVEPQNTMSLAEARATLGVGIDASPEVIRAAHARLIRIAHPDRGGTSGLAAQLNAARDRLLKG